MDGTTDNGGDCVCIDDCNLVRPIYNDDEPKKQTIPTYIWVIMGCLGAGLLALFIGLTTAACFQATTSAYHPRSIIDNPGESFALDQGKNMFYVGLCILDYISYNSWIRHLIWLPFI